MSPRRLSRREFLRMTALLGSGIVLSGCTGDEGPPDKALELIPPRDEAMAMGPLRSQYIDVNGVRMHSLVSSETADPDTVPVVLVHGSGLSGQYMIPTARPLSEHFRVLVPDIPGYGDSGDPGSILNVPEMADWLDAWMEAMQLPLAAFLGNSLAVRSLLTWLPAIPKG